MDVNGKEEEEEKDHANNDNENKNASKEDESADDDFEPLSNYARMDTLVTVLDAFNLGSILGTIESEADRRRFFGEEEEDTDESEESIVQLLIDQIEFANVIILNKIDLLLSNKHSVVRGTGTGDDGGSFVESQIKAIRALVQKLNPKAKVVVPDKPKFEKFDVDKIINTGLFNMEEAQEAPGWIAELEKPYHVPETEEYGIGSFVFRNNERPFHPERLARIFKNFGVGLVNEIAGKKQDDLLDENKKINLFSRVVRCKGELWLSNADCCPIDVHSVGRQLVMTPAGNGKPWMGKVVEISPHGDPESDEAVPEDCELWDTVDLTSETLAELKASNQWTDRFGDRRSELVFIGIKLDKKMLMKELNHALLTDAEFNVAENDRKKVWCTDVKDEFFDGMSLWDLSDIVGEEEDQDETCALEAKEVSEEE